MWRTTSLTVTFALVAAMAGAQTPPAKPRTPAVPKAPAVPVAPVIAPDIERQLDALGVTLDSQAMTLAFDAASKSLEAVGRSFDPDVFWVLQEPVLAKAPAFSFSFENSEYDRGISSLDSGRYDRAVEAFDKVIAQGGKKVDGAMYWKAYALGRLGKRDEAIRTLEEMQKKFPSSRWMNDAKALLIDVRQASGQPVSPDAAGDEELKLIALNGLMMRDPESAIPMVEKLLTGSASPKLKERGLFVLAQSASPRAKTLLAEVAKGKGNPDLQLKALDYLGVFGGGPDVPLLVDVYKSTGDLDVKKRVIRSLGMTGRRGVFAGGYAFDYPAVNLMTAETLRVAELARTEAELARVRTEVERTRAATEATRERAAVAGTVTARGSATAGAAQRGSANTVAAARSGASAEREKMREAKAKEAADALWQLYATEPSVDLKREILVNMRFTTQRDRLLQIARTDGNSDLRRAAVQGLVLDRTPQATELLLGLYRNEKDPAVKRQILDHLMATSSAATLVQLARQETDPAVRKRLVERLSMMKDKEAIDYMMEILKK
jgi:tetratricopeptide (TPR) repeat protein